MQKHAKRYSGVSMVLLGKTQNAEISVSRFKVYDFLYKHKYSFTNAYDLKYNFYWEKKVRAAE